MGSETPSGRVVPAVRDDQPESDEERSGGGAPAIAAPSVKGGWWSRWCRIASHRPKPVLACVVLLVALAGALGAPVMNELHASFASLEDPASPSTQARMLYEKASGASADLGLKVVVQAPVGVDAPQTRRRVARVVQILRADAHVARVVAPMRQKSPEGLVAKDGKAVMVRASFEDIPERQLRPVAKTLQNRLDEVSGVRTGGRLLSAIAIDDVVDADLRRAELISFPFVFLLAVFAFRSLVAAALPTVVGGATIAVMFAVLRAVDHAGYHVSLFALNLVTALSLGLAIDYALFVVSRFREEQARGDRGQAALRTTAATAGRTVVFSALTVTVAIAALAVFPQSFIRSLAIGGALVPLVAATVTITLLFPVLALLGKKVDAFAPSWLQRRARREARVDEAGGWYRLARGVMRRPVLVSLASAAVLLVLAAPAASLKLTGFDSTILPAHNAQRQIVQQITSRFPGANGAQLYEVIQAPGSARPAVADYVRRISRVDGVAHVSVPRRVGSRHGDSVWRVDLSTSSPELTQASRAVVNRVRALREPQGVNKAFVGGYTALVVDEIHSIRGHLPVAAALVLALSFAVLLGLTRSVVLPVKTLLMTALTLTAAVGVLVVVFQSSLADHIPYLDDVTGIDVTSLVLGMGVGFALSTDYGVFLLGRIGELRARGYPNRRAVMLGLERSGRLVTSAALLLCVAIGAIATSDLVIVQEISMGVVAAVLLDAFVVRALLVPALMEMLGHVNWWAPRAVRAVLGTIEPRPSASGTSSASEQRSASSELDSARGAHGEDAG